MKSSSTIIVLSATALFALAGCANQRTTSCTNSTACGEACCGICTAPAGNATAVNAATADALREVLADEQRAHAFYIAVIAKHGTVRPFSNIVHAEERHASVVTTLMERHGVPVPSAAPTNIPAVPATLTECNRLAAQLERENIAMYDRLLANVSEPDIKAAFENLQRVSKVNHLPAFERWSATSARPTPANTNLGARAGRGWARQAACDATCRLTCLR